MRGGIFDRIQLIQDDISVRFHDSPAPTASARSSRKVPGLFRNGPLHHSGRLRFDPAKEFRLQLLVQRPVGPIEKVFLTFDLGYRLPDSYLKTVAPAAAPAAASGQSSGAVAEKDTGVQASGNGSGMTARRTF